MIIGLNGGVHGLFILLPLHVIKISDINRQAVNEGGKREEQDQS